MSIFGLGIGVVVAYLGLTLFLNYRLCPNIRGPLIASVSGIWLFRTTFAGRIYLDMPAVLAKYSSVPLC